MSARTILIDTTRLITRLKHASPSGIDRVDLAYARHFLTGQPARRAVALTPVGARLLPPERLGRLMRLIGERWREETSAESDPVLARLRSRLRNPAEKPPPHGPKRAGPERLRPEVLVQAFRIGALGWPAAGTAPPGSIYLHTSHLRLDRPRLFDWLSARPDIRPVFFVHDLIPIEFPEYVVPGEDARHRVRIETMARHAAAVIANSADVRSRFLAYLAREGLSQPPVTVAPLGVEPAFTVRQGGLDGVRPYLVACSTIEARKNHLILLQAWRDLLARHPPEDVPALVIVGRRGWESEAAIDLLDRCPSLKSHVLEAPGLSTPALAELVSGARALLMPSFAEGYGIPIIEALSLGTPVVASDIPVHREVAGGHAAFVHPLDGPGWMAAIMRAGGADRGPGPSGYSAPTWQRHFEIVESVLQTL